uniref:Uncharacterized protein n=1 Tax=Arundo donax TaxID=35708 RepID=A0A0A8YBI6_ARUDO
MISFMPRRLMRGNKVFAFSLNLSEKLQEFLYLWTEGVQMFTRGRRTTSPLILGLSYLRPMMWLTC